MNNLIASLRAGPRDVSSQRHTTMAVLLALAVAASAQAQQSASSAWFENPPLRYEGPDPTANYFLSPRVAWNQTQQDPVADWKSYGAEELPPLTAPNDNWSQMGETVADPFSQDGFVGGGVTEHKDGFFQKLGASETWIDRDGADDFGINEIDTFVTVAVPAPTREWPLLISPTFNTRLLNGPVTPDLPNQIYETYLDLLWVPRLSPRWTAIIGVAPSYYGDFEADDSNAFRMTGKGLARFDWSPTVQVLFGVLYLNRNDVMLLPAGGIIWTPNDAKRYELLFPRPKLAHRITLGECYEDWIYLGGEFGGNTYAVATATGVDDFITLRDLRAYVGLERKLNGGAGYRLEAGYVFARVVEFESGIPDFEAKDAFMLRGGFTF